MNNSHLNKMKCTACSGKTPKLTMEEITKNLKLLDNWNLNDDNQMVYKKFSFKSFKKSLDFTNIVGKISEEEQHHPDISLGYGYCIIMIHTHAIKGLTINDFILASKIDNISNT